MLNSFLDKFVVTNNLKYKNNNFYLIDTQFLMVPTEILVSMTAKATREESKKTYYAVKQATQEKLMEKFNIDFGLQGQKGLELVETIFTAFGWGQLKNIDLDFDKKQAIVTVSNSPFAENLQGKTQTESDHLIRGILAGLFSKFFSADMECVELECMALGAQACKFILKEKHAFNWDNEKTRQQLEPD